MPKKTIALFMEKYMEMVKNHEMSGWYKLPDTSISTVRKINATAEKILSESEAVVLIGIGGSYLPHRGIIELIGQKSPVQMVYAGTSMSERELQKALNAVDGKDFSVVVISKSGKTREIRHSFEAFKKKACTRYGKKANSRIYVITDDSSSLVVEAMIKEYATFYIPNDVGGRYSALSPAGLLPIAIAGLDIKEILKGAKNAREHDNIAKEYAKWRVSQFYRGCKIEVINAFEPSAEIFLEWVQQLFAESEGKDSKGLFPVPVASTGALHFVGQFIQDGSPGLCETILDLPTDEANHKMLEAVKNSHEAGGRQVFLLDSTKKDNKISEFLVGWLAFTLELTAALSATMMGVDPFDQSGVEVYKEEARKLLD